MTVNLQSLVSRTESDARRATRRAAQVRADVAAIRALDDPEPVLSAFDSIIQMTQCSDAIALRLVVRYGPEKAMRLAEQRVERFEGSRVPSFETYELCRFYERVADEPMAKDSRPATERARQKALAVDLIKAVIDGDKWHQDEADKAWFVSHFMRAILITASTEGRSADDVLRATGLGGAINTDLDQVGDLVEQYAFAAQAFGDDDPKASAKRVAAAKRAAIEDARARGLLPQVTAGGEHDVESVLAALNKKVRRSLDRKP